MTGFLKIERKSESQTERISETNVDNSPLSAKADNENISKNPNDSIKFSVTGENGEIWFVAKDVAAILGYNDTEAMTRRLDSDEVQNLQIVGFGNRGVNIINESGLHSSILGSAKPEAKKFKKWVTSEVLPSIRKTGSYTAPEVETKNEPQSIDWLEPVVLDEFAKAIMW